MAAPHGDTAAPRITWTVALRAAPGEWCKIPLVKTEANVSILQNDRSEAAEAQRLSLPISTNCRSATIVTGKEWPPGAALSIDPVVVPVSRTV